MPVDKRLDPERWQKLVSIFEHAHPLRGDEQSAYLDEACGGDAELRSRAEALLREDSTGGATLRDVIQAAMGDALAAHPEIYGGPESSRQGGAPQLDLTGSKVGPYRLIEEIGRGGMGTVWLAERDDQAYTKTVAVKLMNRGLHSPELLARFKTERQILASLDHPNIARLMDGGTTESGVPYVVMEHVEGQALDRYCDDNRLSTGQRLLLFNQVCQAVSFAHRNLVVHRDLKPANILVTADGIPKLLDFGIAKLLDPAGGGHVVAETATSARLLTPEYASPEQVRGGPVTTCSDVYSLGVVLYEFLTGRRPYQLKSRSLGEVEKIICEQEPDRPSTAVTRDGDDGTSTNPATTTAERISRARSSEPGRSRRGSTATWTTSCSRPSARSRNCAMRQWICSWMTSRII